MTDRLDRFKERVDARHGEPMKPVCRKCGSPLIVAWRFQSDVLSAHVEDGALKVELSESHKEYTDFWCTESPGHDDHGPPVNITYNGIEFYRMDEHGNEIPM